MKLYDMPDNTPPDPKGRLVSTGESSDGEAIIMIHVSGKVTNNYVCDVFYVKKASNTFASRPGRYSEEYQNLVPRGWFQSLTVFDQICNSQATVNPEVWPLAVLTTIRGQYQASWFEY